MWQNVAEMSYRRLFSLPKGWYMQVGQAPYSAVVLQAATFGASG